VERKHEKSQISLDDLKNGGGKEPPVNDHATDPHRQLLQNELKVVVDDAIDKLSMEHKAAILLWQEGLSYSEIAVITNTQEKTVGSRIYHAKMQLRDFLKPYLRGKK